MDNLFLKLKAVADHQSCLKCGLSEPGKLTYGYEEYLRVSETNTCIRCGCVKYSWEYGGYDSPWVFLDTPFKRFKYLFLGKY